MQQFTEKCGKKMLQRKMAAQARHTPYKVPQLYAGSQYICTQQDGLSLAHGCFDIMPGLPL
jgi:hypothetical protein